MRAIHGKAVIVATLAFSGALFVAETAAANNLSCYWAINSACGGTRPDGASVRACFETHSSRLQRSCGHRLPHFIAVTRQCDTDQRRLCGKAARASAVVSCMNRRLAEVSASCRNALVKVGVRGAGRR